MSSFSQLEPSLVEVAITEGVEPPASPSLNRQDKSNKKNDKNSKSNGKKSKSSSPVQRSMSDRYSYRAAIYNTATDENGS